MTQIYITKQVHTITLLVYIAKLAEKEKWEIYLGNALFKASVRVCT